MPDNSDLIFRLALTGTNGVKTPFQFTAGALRDLIVQMLTSASQAPLTAEIERQLVLDESPIPANGFMVTPLEDDPQGAHVSIGIGPLNLQFAISLDVLLQALRDLESKTEPGTMYPQRPN